MTSPIARLLLDTCSIINLSYCPPVAAIFRSRYQGTAGWTEAGSTDSALDHLGEAASIALLQSAGAGRLISDDHAARGKARKRGVRASSTVGVIAQLLTIDRSGVDATTADNYLRTLQERDRMHVRLKAVDLLIGDLGPWQ